MSDRTIHEIPIEELHDSPYNPPDRARLRIDEMVATIASAGDVILLNASMSGPQRPAQEVEDGTE